MSDSLKSGSGFSIVVCCYNSADIIEDTLRSLSRLQTDGRFGIEILLIDNCSTDNTSEVSRNFLKQSDCDLKFRILREERSGLSFARRRGIDEAAFDYIILCDDDNRLTFDYAVRSFELMENNKSIGALGGFGNAVSMTAFPKWFDSYRKSYSTGAQSEIAGDITSAEGYVWGAGMVLRKSAVEGLYRRGFTSLLSDRYKEILSSGGDVELCYALRLSGFRIYFDPQLKFDHYIHPERLNWKYLRKLYRGFGMQKPLLEPYLEIYKDTDKVSPKSWKKESVMLARRFRSYGMRKLKDFARLSEGNDDVLRIEKTLGRLQQMSKLKKDYEKNFEMIRKAEWNMHSAKK